MDDAPESSSGTDGDADRPIDRLDDHWQAVVGEVESIAEEYRDAGAEVVELHPADVVARPDLGGFDVPVSDAEFDALRALVADTALPQTDLYRARAGDVVFVAAMLTAADDSAAVCCPLFYEVGGDVASVEDDSREQGALRVLVRPFEAGEGVVLQFDDPGLFFGENEPSETDGKDEPKHDGSTDDTA